MDETNSTLDGKYYDNTEYKCWKFTWEYTEKSTGEADVHESGVDYEWLTELWAQYEKAMWLYSHNVSASAYGASASVTGTCTLEQTPDDEYALSESIPFEASYMYFELSEKITEFELEGELYKK